MDFDLQKIYASYCFCHYYIMQILCIALLRSYHATQNSTDAKFLFAADNTHILYGGVNI